MPLSNKGWDETASCSTDLRRQSRCRPALTGTRAQARGDPRMASDESDGKAGKSADDVRDEFEEKMDRLRRQYERDLHSFRYEIEEREYRLKAYEDKFNKSSSRRSSTPTSCARKAPTSTETRSSSRGPRSSSRSRPGSWTNPSSGSANMSGCTHRRTRLSRAAPSATRASSRRSRT